MKKLNNKIVFLLVACMGIGFAYLTSTLTITGNTSVSGNKWNVYFTNVEVNEDSIEASVIPSTTGTTTTSLDYTVTLDKPGDFYEFTVDAVNDGTIDAMIQNINMTSLDSDVEKYLDYTATYLDGTPLAEQDVLEKGKSTTYKVRVEYKKDIEASDLSEEGVSLSLIFGVNYVQSTIEVEEPNTVIFGQAWNIDYTGEEYTFTVPKTGAYKLEVWGAQGGTTSGGYGGYSSGLIDLNENSTLYVNVGGQGGDSYTRTGGYNGGGTGGAGYGSWGSGSGGGGATHIATNSGLLSSLSENVNSVLIVAGGGGGTCGGFSPLGGSGGGASGTLGYALGSHNQEAGTQTKTSRNIFGQGTNGRNGTYTDYGGEGNGGAGGGFYGGVASTISGKNTDSNAPGGSGYIGNTNLNGKVMYCYNCQETDVNATNYENIKTISTTNISSSAVSNYAKTGNGYARIIYPATAQVYLSNYQKSTNSVEINNYNIDLNKGKISFETSLTNTTDFVEFSFDIKNSSEKNLYVSKIQKSNYDSSKIEYTVKYLNDGEVEKRDLLSKNSTKTIVVNVKLLDNSASFENKNFSFNISLGEAENNKTYTKEIWNIDYTGTEQTFTIPYDGIYKLEVWGAQGGTADSNYIGGYGGYSSGVISLNAEENLYINVGGQGTVCNGLNYKAVTTCKGGYNGGGSSIAWYYTDTNYSYSGSGGGATHIATSSGLLSNLSNNENSLLIVAGGGGGSLKYQTDPKGDGNGGSAGGYIGESVAGCGTAGGGSQNSGGVYNTCNSKNGSSGAFGLGGNATQNIGAGGGAGYYGGGGSYYSIAGGGSGYIGNNNLSNKAMYCYHCSEPSTSDENYENIKTISTTDVSISPVSEYAKIGNGYAKITYLGN